ncbi:MULTISPECIES: helix-turn-helix domain-containing protein [unclassified Ruminococcus]|uniref:helix-turn-helix domain-containing protein n=1 Tax=unclassified Ruminococcus TaxID=2608920 RepID=UPI0021086A80|nr:MULTISPECIES: helix-turn-helix domain-containing protein [unclassified Ruminococcus]MCQ4022745.1 helix-turn-helix domain-containing protein [Ruminococcus sp. zg-924]MCQ4114985.1 helix-turn-helix domain-containing protein [Ruminococcus sp. zg-921]
MIDMNLKNLRKKHNLSQEKLAEKLGVSRQAVAKWENGDALPDIMNCQKLSELYRISIDELINCEICVDELRKNEKDGKHVFGAVTVGERGQIVIPIKAREVFDIKAGDKILILGDEDQGIALVKLKWFSSFGKNIFSAKEDEEE